jgi:hypothetical protein
MVTAIDERDVELRRATEELGRIQPGEASADDHDALVRDG